MAGITRIEAAFFAAAADVDLPGRVVVVEPRNSGAHRRRPGSWGARRSDDPAYDPAWVAPLPDERQRPRPRPPALASANSAALRSKKLCGAPG